MTAGTPGHMYLEERQAKCLRGQGTAGDHGRGCRAWAAGAIESQSNPRQLEEIHKNH